MRKAKAVLGPIADHVRTASGNINLTNVDVGLLVRRLVLFDRVVIKSIRFRELPFLVGAFGESGTRALISEGRLQFFSDQLFVVTDVATNGIRQLPLFHFNFGLVKGADPERNLRKEFGALRTIAGLKNQQREAIEDAVWNSQVHYPNNFGETLLNQIDSDFRCNTRAIKKGIVEQLKRRNLPNVDLSSYDFNLKVDEVAPRIFRFEASFGKDFGLSQEEIHKIIQGGATSAANLNQRLLEMIELSALTGYQEEESDLLFGKLAGLVTPNPTSAEEQFKRVIEISDIPDFKPNQRIDVEKLLEIRDSDQCRAFRDWLSEASELSDEDLRAMTHGIKNKISSLGSSAWGKSIRLAATTGIGLIPGAGLVLGPAASAVDTFLVDRALKRPAVVAFLSDIYPSLFESA